MKQPPGFVHPDFPHHVCKLQNPIFCQKQALRAWFAKLRDKLLSLGFCSSSFDYSLFIMRANSECLFIRIYFDDIIMTGSSALLISEFIAALRVSFPVKDLGSLHYFLGIEVYQNTFGLFLSQSKYITDLLHKTNMIIYTV